MAEREYSKHQKKIIQRYYENRDSIDQERLAELVTSIYLETGKKREKSWKAAEEVMRRLKVPETRIAHVMQSADPAVLAAVVEDIQNGRI